MLHPVFVTSCAALTCLAAVAGCAVRDAAPARSSAADPISIAIVGDTGYAYEYLETKDLVPALSVEQLIAQQREKWVDDKRPLEDFEPTPVHLVGTPGAAVAASGLDVVAGALRGQCAQPPRCDFAVMLGDNIYPDGATLGADGKDDLERFRRVFSEPYGALFGDDRDARIYTVLGNHDWKTSRAGARAQADWMAATPPFYMDGFFYRVVPPGLEGEVEIFALDTHLMLGGVQVFEEELGTDGSELAPHEIEEWQPWARPQDDAERRMAQWLEESLRASRARWKIVIGHHPLWSSAGSKFEQARALRRMILPALCRYADLYLAGHDHTLELHTDDCAGSGAPAGMEPLPQLVSGAGGKQRGINRLFRDNQLRLYPQLRTLYARGMVWGFAQLVIDGDRAQLRIVATPDDGNGSRTTEFEHAFERRTRLLRSGAAHGGGT